MDEAHVINGKVINYKNFQARTFLVHTVVHAYVNIVEFRKAQVTSVTSDGRVYICTMD